MDLRIGAKSPVYGVRPASKVTDHALRTSFARMMAREKQSISQGSAAGGKSPAAKADSISQDTVTISGNDLAQRLENVHQKIDEIDFTGKNRYEKYKLIYDAYEEEFGHLGLLFYLDEDTYNIIDQDKQTALANAIPGYSRTDGWLHRHAMGYDQMSKEETIAAIKERVGGNTYVHKYCELAELERAGIITPSQGSEIFHDMRRKAEKEYCAEMGFDHLTLFQHLEEYYGVPFEKAVSMWEKNLLSWTAKTEITWLEIFEGIEKYSTRSESYKDAFMKEIEETSELLIESDDT